MIEEIGNFDAPIVVVWDAPTKEAAKAQVPMVGPQYEAFVKHIKAFGFNPRDFAIISPCPPIPKIAADSEKRKADFLAEWRETFEEVLADYSPRVIVYMGNLAGRQVTGRAVKITRVRGQIMEAQGRNVPILPMLSVGNLLRRPEIEDVFKADLNMLRILYDHDFNIKASSLAVGKTNYQWCFDLEPWFDDRPKTISVDTETTGLDWFRDDVRPFSLQLCRKPGEAIMLPLFGGWHEEVGPRVAARIRKQAKQLLEDPSIIKVGHNAKFDHHMLRKIGIEVAGWGFDTQIGAFLVDENMMSKDLAECVRRWVPEMAGYSDVFDQTTDKGDMINVPKEQILSYGCGDADATFRLARALYPLARMDERQWNCHNRIISPAMAVFRDIMEPNGIRIDVDKLADLQEAIKEEFDEGHKELIKMVPRTVKRKHADKGLSFTRSAFIIDTLFSEDGFGLTPRVFTKATRNLPDKDKVPSVSAKDHLPYFADNPFVSKLMDHVRLTKLKTTYVGQAETEETPASGFWKYLNGDEIHPSFMLHRVVTGRTASANPNAQNFPKRGRLAKAFRKVFIPRPGFKFLEADLSQAELRIAAWMANEENMIRVYAEGGDIHANTAAATIGMGMREFSAWKKSDSLAGDLGNIPGINSFLRDHGNDATIGQFFDFKRFQAKAVNFGFLYGMWWKKFRAYAKTDYGLDFTEREAQEIREMFFAAYPGLEDWHNAMREFVREHGYVRALHGAIRHLPNINSHDDSIRGECERQAINSPVQRFASDLGLIGLHRFSRDVDVRLARPIAFIHDAIVAEVAETHIQEVATAIKWYLESTPFREWFRINPPLPITADVSVGDNLADMEELNGLISVEPEWAQADNAVIC